MTPLFTGVLSLFQSTLPRGERRRADDRGKRSILHFNPRSHEGSDTSSPWYPVFHKISIHAPTRGATLTAPLTFVLILPFQSALPRGERPLFRRDHDFII